MTLEEDEFTASQLRPVSGAQKGESTFPLKTWRALVQIQGIGES
jgi:hypothetical protein